jgi:hypothetical protein
MPEPPKEPDPAESALASFTGALASLRNIAGLSPLSENNEPTSEDIEGPIYDEEQQCITYRIAEIVPRFTDRDLPPFLLWLEGLSDGIDLALSTVLFGASIPTPIQDELILRVACSPRRDHSQVAA